MSNTAIFTSCAANYIPKARVLADSVKRLHADIDVYLLAVDEIPPQFDLAREPFDFVVRAGDLAIPDFDRWLFQHRIVEACTAVKPFMLLHLLEKNYDQVLYFDPDIALFSLLDGMLDAFEEHSILLTPHICKPEATPEAVADNEICALAHGVFNFGYVGVKNDATGRAYAGWWADRCYQACFDDIAHGVFTDQKWNDLVPVFFEQVGILKQPVYNVATWNYAQRQIEGNLEEGFTVDGEPMVFHHFTGYDSGAHHAMLGKYGTDMPATRVLSQWYEAQCQRFEQKDLAAVKWAYGFYDNGAAVRPHHRLLYRQRPDLRDSFPEPLSTRPQGPYKTSYYHWLEREGLLETAATEGGDARPFNDFLQQTQAELVQYIRRTRRLSDWQKKAALATCDSLFSLLKLPLKKAG